MNYVYKNQKYDLSPSREIISAILISQPRRAVIVQWLVCVTVTHVTRVQFPVTAVLPPVVGLGWSPNTCGLCSMLVLRSVAMLAMAMVHT